MATVTILQKKLRAYAKKVGKAQATLDREFTKTLRANRLFLAELNREQLLQGDDESGNPIGARLPYRSPEYAKLKSQLNPLAGLGNPDLRLTGDYWDSIDAKIENRTIQMFATDDKADDLSPYKGIGIAPYNYPEIANLLQRLVKLELH